MRILPIILMSAALAWPCAAAEPPQRPGPTGAQGAACLDRPDPGVCLMRLALPFEKPDAMAYDDVFLEHPELAARLGLDAEGIDASRPLGEDHGDFRRRRRAKWLALKAALAGAPPGAVLAPLSAIPVVPTHGTDHSRANDLSELFSAVHNRPGLPGKAELEAAILKLWEAETRQEPTFIGLFDEGLTGAYVTAGDYASAERLYREGWRIPPGSPAWQEASVLIASQQWDRARAVLIQMPADPAEAQRVAQERIMLANSMARFGEPGAPAYVAEVLAAAEYDRQDPLPVLRLFEYLLKAGTPEQIRAVAGRLDAAPPTVTVEDSFLSMLLFKAYRRLGDTARADALLAAWRPPAGDASFREEVYGRMLLSDGKRPEVLARGWPLERVVQGELLDQQAIADLEGWLATLSPEDRKRVLKTCSDAGLSLGPIPQIRACERQTVADPTVSGAEADFGLIIALADPTDRDVTAVVQTLGRRWREHPESRLDSSMVRMIGEALYDQRPTAAPAKP